MILKTFTYSQYIKCIHTFRLNAVMQLAEETTEYKLEDSQEKYLQGELLKYILQSKKEVARLINQFVEPREKIKGEDLVSYTSNSYLTKKYRAKEVDLIYKLKNKEIFYLLECQSKIDNKIDYRMLNYCLDIMREWTQNKKTKKITSYPIVVPILIYTGRQKWKTTKELQERPWENYSLIRYKMNLEYNFVDMNKFSKQMLLNKSNILSYAMLLEKSKGDQELTQDLENIIALTEDKKKLMELFSMIRYVLSSTLNENVQHKLLREIEKKIMRERNDKESIFSTDDRKMKI